MGRIYLLAVLLLITAMPVRADSGGVQAIEQAQIVVVRNATWASFCGFRDNDWLIIETSVAHDRVQIAAWHEWPDPNGNNPGFVARQAIGTFENQMNVIMASTPTSAECRWLKGSAALAAMDADVAQAKARRAALND